MFRTIVMSGFIAATLACGLSFAQTRDEGPSPEGDLQEPAGAAPAMGSAPSARQLIASCRSEARAKGLSGEAFRSALDECVGAQRPRAAARLHCRQEGRAQGMSGDALRGFVKSCASQGNMGQDYGRQDQDGPPSADMGIASGGPQEGAPSEGPSQEEPQQEGAPQEGAPAMDRNLSAKELIANCRSDARAKGLTQDALESAVNDCVAAQRPRAAARLQCRQQGRAQGASGEELRDFVRNCLAQR
jgi:hypothetical protein